MASFGKLGGFITHRCTNTAPVRFWHPLLQSNTVMYLNLARNIAKDIERRKFRHVSIITNGKEILSLGTNQHKTHPMAVKLHYKYPVLHSELHAYTKLTYTQKRQTLYLYNYRFNKNLVVGMSKPCKYCLGWCLEVFDKIWYTLNEDNIEVLL